MVHIKIDTLPVFLDIAHQLCYILFIQSKGVADIPSGMQFEIDYSMRRHPYQMRQQDFYCGTSHSKSLFLLYLRAVQHEKVAY